jgi:hypothetical protein
VRKEVPLPQLAGIIAYSSWLTTSPAASTVDEISNARV